MSKIRTGELFRPVPIFYSAAVALVADRIYAIPFFVTRNLTIDRLYIEVTILSAEKIARLGIYKDGTNIYPGTLVKDYGTVSVEAVAVVYAEAIQALTKGLHWLVIVSNGTPAIMWWCPNWLPLGVLATNLGTSGSITYWYKAAVGSGALADSFVSDASQGNNVLPGIAPRLLSLN